MHGDTRQTEQQNGDHSDGATSRTQIQEGA